MKSTCVIPRWQLLKEDLRNLDPVKFLDAFAKEKDAVLIDVRTKEEYAQGSLDGALHLNYFDYSFLDKLDLLDRSIKYYIFCRTGRRSVRAGILMKNWGFKHIINMDGGMVAMSG